MLQGTLLSEGLCPPFNWAVVVPAIVDWALFCKSPLPRLLDDLFLVLLLTLWLTSLVSCTRPSSWSSLNASCCPFLSAWKHSLINKHTKIFHTSPPLQLIFLLMEYLLSSHSFSKEFPTIILWKLTTPSQHTNINYNKAWTWIFVLSICFPHHTGSSSRIGFNI